jgi:hypothetical protein
MTGLSIKSKTGISTIKLTTMTILKVYVVTGYSNSGKDTVTTGITNKYPAAKVIKFNQPTKKLMVGINKYVSVSERTWPVESKLHSFMNDGIPLIFNDVLSLIELEFIICKADNYNYDIIHVVVNRPGVEVPQIADNNLESIRSKLEKISLDTLTINNRYRSAEKLIASVQEALTV